MRWNVVCDVTPISLRASHYVGDPERIRRKIHAVRMRKDQLERQLLRLEAQLAEEEAKVAREGSG